MTDYESPDPIRIVANGHLETESAQYIAEHVLPQVLEQFFSKNADYGDQHREFGLGPRAEFVGLWRKMWKLRAAIWDDKEMNYEQPKEMLHDLIGQALILLDLWDQDHSFG